ncbi:targeting protein for Xklp2-A-like [Canna indica]|uniref:Targeting protein for Xklp2-A-like n=1 Tax=Canna indica TaxID=4628 RepID=A0AAQ3QJW6_9LILI|nr:targeting protein for Xklp2-A-like [Canna indica]
MATPVKKSQTLRRQTSESAKLFENVDPNLLLSTPCRRPTKSPASRPMKPTLKASSRTLTPSPSPANRKSSVTPKMKRSKILGENLDSKKFLHELAMECDGDNKLSQSFNIPNGSEKVVVEDLEVNDLEGSAKARAMRRLMLEEAMSGVPAQGAGRVMYLVKTFERLLSIPKEEKQGESGGEVKRKVANWALPGLQFRPKAKLSDFSSSPVSSSAECLQGNSAEHPSVSSKDRSIGSSGRSKNKRLKVKALRPFKLRTEQRGRFKEEQFIKKVKEMFLEEEKKRMPIAQGLPWTTDEPEIPMKPPVKEPTEPIDLVLHSDVRAVERAEFDLQIAEHLSFIEQIKIERERQQKLEEEEEIRRLRRELVPKAQPMPYFDRPFIPRKKQSFVIASDLYPISVGGSTSAASIMKMERLPRKNVRQFSSAYDIVLGFACVYLCVFEEKYLDCSVVILEGILMIFINEGMNENQVVDEKICSWMNTN